MPKPITLVDENDNPIGVGDMIDAWKTGKRHRVVRIMVVASDGSVLLQKRSKTQHSYPDYWDNSAAGHVDANEEYEVAAKRELAEEIGLMDVKLEPALYYSSDTTYKDYHFRRFNKVYTVSVSKDTAVKADEDEVSEVKWFTPEELKKLCNDPSSNVTPGVIEVLQRLKLI